MHLTSHLSLYNVCMIDGHAREAVLLSKNNLPVDSAWLFPEYEFESMNLEEYRGIIIERMLERGAWEQIKWLFKTYGETNVADWVRKHGYRLLSNRSFALWRLVLGIDDISIPGWMIEAKNMEPW